MSEGAGRGTGPQTASTRMSTHIGRLALSNPVICGSGEPVLSESGIRAALAAGAAGVIAKSVNEQPAAARQLDKADYVRLDGDNAPIGWNENGVSLLCRSGLQQREAGDWFRAIAALDRDAAREGRFVAASLVLGSHEGGVELIRLARRSGVRLFEANVGAPHAAEARPGAIGQETDPESLRALVARFREAAGDMILWVKLTGLSNNLPALAVAARDGGAEAVVMMGRFVGMVPDLDEFGPVLGTSGAYGGPWALPIVCRFLALSRQALGPDFPLLGTNGVRSGADVARMGLAGARATEMLSAVMEEGFGALTRVVRELDQVLADRNLTFEALIGRAGDRLKTYAQQPESPGKWRQFVPPETLAPAATS